MKSLTILAIAIAIMFITIVATIKLKIKSPIKKISFKRDEKPAKLSIPMKIIGYVIYSLAILFLLSLLIIFGPWVLYYIEMHY